MSNSFLSAMFKLFHWQVVYNMENTSKMSGHHIQEWKINILIQIITEVSQERSSIASDILTPVASTSPGHYHVNFRLSNFATRHNQTRGWVQLSVFRWIAILLFSMTTLELTCILILRALRWHFLTALRCSNLPLNSSFQRIKLRSFHCFQMLSVEARISLYWTSLKKKRHYFETINFIHNTFGVDETTKHTDVEANEVEDAVLIISSNHHPQVGDQDVL